MCDFFIWCAIGARAPRGRHSLSFLYGERHVLRYLDGRLAEVCALYVSRRNAICPQRRAGEHGDRDLSVEALGHPLKLSGIPSWVASVRAERQLYKNQVRIPDAEDVVDVDVIDNAGSGIRFIDYRSKQMRAGHDGPAPEADFGLDAGVR